VLLDSTRVEQPTAGEFVSGLDYTRAGIEVLGRGFHVHEPVCGLDHGRDEVVTVHEEPLSESLPCSRDRD
jgi:hypothetical protein